MVATPEPPIDGRRARREEAEPLAPGHPGVDGWDDLSEHQQRFNCRLQEAFAAFLDHTGDQIGRLVDGLRDMGELDNTVFVVLSDNGASQEGCPFGVMHEMKFFNGIFETADQMIGQIDDIGGPHSHTNYPWGLGTVRQLTVQWYKQNTHEGGVRVPMIVSAASVAEPSILRDQFVNVSDVVPTIYEMISVTAPEVYEGVEQLPVTGRSFTNALADASAPTANTVQYFEMAGSRALVAGDQASLWKAVCKHDFAGDLPRSAEAVALGPAGDERVEIVEEAFRLDLVLDVDDDAPTLVPITLPVSVDGEDNWLVVHVVRFELGEVDRRA